MRFVWNKGLLTAYMYAFLINLQLFLQNGLHFGSSVLYCMRQNYKKENSKGVYYVS